MPVSKSDVPGATQPKGPPPKESPKVAAPASPSPLAPASESSDPRAHRLLADRQLATDNGDVAGVEAATAALAELGYR